MFDNLKLSYKLLHTSTNLISQILEANKYTLTEGNDWNIYWTSTSDKQTLYQGLNEFQRINHFPNSFEITRKDRLCANYVKAQQKFGTEEFDFIPDTYIIPLETTEFVNHYQALAKT